MKNYFYGYRILDSNFTLLAAELLHGIASGDDIKIVDKINYHITVLYLGAVASEKIAEYNALLAAKFANYGPLQLWVEKLAVFRGKKMSAIVLQVASQDNQLQHLHSAMVQELSIADDLKMLANYKPHITIAKCKTRVLNNSNTLSANLNSQHQLLSNKILLNVQDLELMFLDQASKTYKTEATIR